MVTPININYGTHDIDIKPSAALVADMSALGGIAWDKNIPSKDDIIGLLSSFGAMTNSSEHVAIIYCDVKKVDLFITTLEERGYDDVEPVYWYASNFLGSDHLESHAFSNAVTVIVIGWTDERVVHWQPRDPRHRHNILVGPPANSTTTRMVK